MSETVINTTTNDDAFKRGLRLDFLFKSLTALSAFLVLASVFGIILLLIIGAFPSIEKFGLGFLVSSDWDPVKNIYGGLIAIFGTLVTSFIALLIAVPVSFGIALYITQLAPSWLKGPVATAVELLAAVPSIIYGMWGLFVFAPLFAKFQPWISDTIGEVPFIGPFFHLVPGVQGIGVFTAALILAIMIIPFISSIMRDVFEVVPPVLKESAYGLGATTWEVVWNVVLPYTKMGVVGGIMLGLGRALGETMAVTFVIGNAQRLSESLFAGGNTISSTIANEFLEAEGLHRAALLELGLILFVITFVILALSRLMLMKMTANEGKRS